VSVEVTPEGVTGFWGEERKLVGKISFPRARKSAESFLASLRRQSPNDETAREFRPLFGPDGALGLFVRRGTASFRRVVLEPLEAAE
jgi:hypothetical protein